MRLGRHLFVGFLGRCLHCQLSFVGSTDRILYVVSRLFVSLELFLLLLSDGLPYIIYLVGVVAGFTRRHPCIFSI